jgi:hypothetical protein
MQEDLSELLQHLNARPGVPTLKLGKQVRPENVWQRCVMERSASGQRHKAVVHTKGPHTWLGFEPKERYCSTDEYYTGQHAHCKAGIAAYFADDLRLLSGSGRAN